LTTKTGNNLDQCYITGRPKNETECYYFGSETRVLLRLTQEAFAHFIIRAGRDTMHKQIMDDIKTNAEGIKAFSQEFPEAPTDVDTYIDAAIKLAILTDEREKLLTQKCESGVRILRQMRKDYQTNGKLTS